MGQWGGVGVVRIITIGPAGADVSVGADEVVGFNLCQMLKLFESVTDALAIKTNDTFGIIFALA
jgi:hypothetical protein